MERRNRFYYLILFSLIFVLGFATYLIIKPFVSALAWAIVFSIVFYPIYGSILKLTKIRAIASIITVAIIVFIIVGPLAYLSFLIVKEMDEILSLGVSSRSELSEVLFQNPGFSRLLKKLMETFSLDEERIHEIIREIFQDAIRAVLNKLRIAFENVPSFFMKFFLMLISIYFFLKDGPDLLEKTKSFLPFREDQKRVLFKQVRDIITTTIYGGVVVAVLQSLIAGFTFLILGIKGAALLGFATFFASFVPVFGTFIVWGPYSFYLIYLGNYAKGLALLLLGAGLISMVDNIVRPLIVRQRVKMPLIVVFFSILGGISLFGIIGVIIGPLIVALFVSVLEILRLTEEGRQEELEERRPENV